MIDERLICGPIPLSFAQITNAGGRQSNQDALGVARQDDLACFVVSDGVGGHAGGEIASNIVVEAVLDRFLRESSFGSRALRSYVDHAVVQIARRKGQEQPLQGMSATVAAVLIDQKNRCALWAHMGDTRIYLFRHRMLQSVTKDHSMVQQFIDAGYSQPELLRAHPQRSTLFAAIGAEGDTLPEVTQAIVEIDNGDAFLICTDGLWEWIDEAEMEQTLALAASAEDWLITMRDIAEKKGRASPKARDNYTAYTIWLGEPEAVTVKLQNRVGAAGQ